MSNATLQNDYHFLEDVKGRMESNQRFLRQSGGKQQHSKRQRQLWMIPENSEDGGETAAHTLLQAARKEGIAPKRLILPMELQNNQWRRDAGEQSAAISNDPSEQQHHSSRSAAHQRTGFLSNLQNHARHRGVTLLRLPPFMERHKRNETRIRNKMIYWTIEWRIYHGNNNNTAGSDTNTTTMTIAQTCETAVLYDELRRLVENADPCWAQHSLLLKNELSPAKAPMYTMISKSSTLLDALTDQTIIEFPTIHAVPPCRLTEFPLLIQINPNEDHK
jgi:hypothetical protein